MSAPTCRRLELHVQSLSPDADRLPEELLDDIRTLDDRETITGHSVSVWGDEVGLSTTAQS
ncbi:HTH domain-containing protein [Haloarculaceae archaeon H-GB2-1]|nr:hypothetical protein [Haloarculaceae archaeon H-GB1-1]MEA5386520.1 HTH domain-containing protein [Haloarculaceae archaeon H-GB11]MEA5408034.1 HTH domain-containing protein [Haloarculaceae archaeon H-GB2-1]